MTQSKRLSIALCMIAKDKADTITRALDSTKGIFDKYYLQDTGSSDDTVKVFQDWCKANDKPFKTQVRKLGGKKGYRYVTIEGNRILADFGKARNDSFNMARADNMDFAFWMDTDDALINVELLPKLALEMRKSESAATVLIYNYAKSSDGLKPVVQKRERLLDLSYPGEWIDRVHENYIIGVPNPKIMINEEVYLDHLRTPFEAMATSRRNKLIMEDEIKTVGLDKVSDKIILNAAYDHWEHKEYEDSIKLYKQILKRHDFNVNPEMGLDILMKISKAYIEMGKTEKAVTYAMRASRINKKASEPYLILAQAYMTLDNMEEVVHYAQKVLDIGMPNTTNPINEYDYLVIPRLMLIQAYMKEGDIENSMRISNELTQITDNPQFKKDRWNILKEKSTRGAIEGLANLLRYMQETNDSRMMDRLITAIPLSLKDHHVVRGIIAEASHDYRRKNHKITLDGKKSIVIWAGRGFEDWDGNSDIEKGIGGSEGMCIQMARELAKLGNQVVVYNQCGESAGKTFNGVLYEDYRKWNPNLKCDIFISLRDPGVFRKLLKAKKTYLWLHDTGYGDVPLSLFYSPNKVICLSEAHRDVLKLNHGIEDDNAFFLTRNGLNDFAIKDADNKAGKRNPYQLIYASSYDRGLDNLLKMWGKIKEEVPEASLKIFYGWQTYDAIMNGNAGNARGQSMARYKSNIVDMIAKSEDVKELGRVTQPELYKEFAESSIWLYPTEFYEISCINAMTAQAMGAVPVCTPFAALNETVSNKYGLKVPLEKMADGVIHLLKNQGELEKRRDEMIKWARKEYSMATLAQSWDKFFNEN